MKVCLVLLLWILLTTAAAAFTPERGERHTRPDLTVDTHWQLRTPYSPVTVDKATARRVAQTTTTTRHTTPPPTKRAAAPRPPPTRPNNAGVEQWRPLVASYPDWSVDLMLRVMWCESRGNPNADNPRSTANGLFQILDGPFDPAANVSLAHSMWSSRGTQPWSASRSCWS